MRQVKRQIKVAALAVWTPVVGIGLSLSSTRVEAQIGIGSVGASTSIAGTLGGIGNSAPSAGQLTRGLPGGAPSARPGSDTAFNEGNPFGSGATGANSGGAPNFPNVGTGVVAQSTIRPFHWTNMRGIDFLNELRGRPTVRSRSRARGVRNNPRRPLAKYRVPPRNWLAFYLPQDRYKITLNIWRYVALEDDRGRYPSPYYYKPNAPTFLSLIARSPRGVVRPYRVIGFASWQDAMVAGYRPDPVSKPDPALGVLALGRLSTAPSVLRYIEATYAGQIAPNDFASGVRYVRNVGRIVASRRDTRSQTRTVVAQSVSALLGEGPFPTSVTGSPVRVTRRVLVTTQTTSQTSGAPGGYSGGSPGTTPGVASISGNPNVGANRVPDAGNRSEDYNRFRSNAAGLRAR